MKQTRVKQKKRWSQNFFNDPEVLAELLDMMDIYPDDHILEIGPGLGVMTTLLLERAKQVMAVEIDPQLIGILNTKFEDQNHFDLIHQDIMTFDLERFTKTADFKHRKVIANIPYHITTPIMLTLLNELAFKKSGIQSDTPLFSDIYLMVQKEVAERIVSPPGKKNYGAISLVVNYAAETDILAIIPKTFFYPVPKTDSAILHLKPRLESPVELNDLATYWKLIRGVYQYRRKTLRNVLKNMKVADPVREQLDQEFNLGLRGEVFGLSEMAELSNRMAELILGV